MGFNVQGFGFRVSGVLVEGLGVKGNAHDVHPGFEVTCGRVSDWRLLDEAYPDLFPANRSQTPVRTSEKGGLLENQDVVGLVHQLQANSAQIRQSRPDSSEAPGRSIAEGGERDGSRRKEATNTVLLELPARKCVCACDGVCA